MFAFSDGQHIAVMPPSQDHKRLLEGNTGPMTGGVGAYSPCPQVCSKGSLVGSQIARMWMHFCMLMPFWKRSEDMKLHVLAILKKWYCMMAWSLGVCPSLCCEFQSICKLGLPRGCTCHHYFPIYRNDQLILD